MQRSSKRLREDTELLKAPEILISNSSTSTMIQEEDNINSNPLTAAHHRTVIHMYLHKTESFKRKSGKIQLPQRFFVKMYTGKICPEGTRNHT